MIEKYFCNCLYFSANHLTRVITKMAEEEFAVTGLSPSYAFAMMVINSRSGISQNELCEILNLTASTITRFIDKLENKSLAKRESQGKMSFIYSTEKGKLLQGEIEKCWKNLYERYSIILGNEQGTEFSNQICEIAKKLENA